MSEDKKEFDMTDIDNVASQWKDVSWDKIQRMRFVNADQEIAPDDSYTKKYKKE
jgi:hypothetical protein|tara:strand:+ start:6493 stop:6654 length:162 start_codon:yes stop_codon:yes gene_type:complete